MKTRKIWPERVEFLFYYFIYLLCISLFYNFLRFFLIIGTVFWNTKLSLRKSVHARRKISCFLLRHCSGVGGVPPLWRGGSCRTHTKALFLASAPLQPCHLLWCAKNIIINNNIRRRLRMPPVSPTPVRPSLMFTVAACIDRSLIANSHEHRVKKMHQRGWMEFSENLILPAPPNRRAEPVQAPNKSEPPCRRRRASTSRTPHSLGFGILWDF